jgi:hypothetical protein
MRSWGTVGQGLLSKPEFKANAVAVNIRQSAARAQTAPFGQLLEGRAVSGKNMYFW